MFFVRNYCIIFSLLHFIRDYKQNQFQPFPMFWLENKSKIFKELSPKLEQNTYTTKLSHPHWIRFPAEKVPTATENSQKESIYAKFTNYAAQTFPRKYLGQSFPLPSLRNISALPSIKYIYLLQCSAIDIDVLAALQPQKLSEHFKVKISRKSKSSANATLA